MINIKGIGINAGIAMGKAKIRRMQKIEVNRTPIHHTIVKNEIERFHVSIQESVDDIDYMIKHYTYSKDDRDILTTHKLILQDPEFLKNIQYLISNELLSLEYALHKHFTDLIALFQNMENEYFAQRATDYEDVHLRLLNQVMGNKLHLDDGLDGTSILVMDDIAPSFVPVAFKKGIRGLCLEKGSRTSHSSIIARSLNLVTIVGADRLTDIVKDNDTLIVNGKTNEIIINPDEETIAEFRKLIIEQELERKSLEEMKDKACLTKDGKRITIVNNIEFPDEIDTFLKYQADGVGLFRTEFLYLSRIHLPSENEQFDVYKSVAEKMKGKPFTIRTIDIGGDKLSSQLNIAKETNPNLGLRGVRLTLRHPDIFKSQIKAILRASIYGNFKIMFPMISGVQELNDALEIVEQCKRALDRDEIPYKKDIPIGVMIEVPSAVFVADKLAERSDFFSIGTNDLVQYALAVDRNSENVAEYYNPYHPAIFKMLKRIAICAKAENIPVSICGEIAADSDFVPILLGIGINNISVSPNFTLKSKYEISKLNLTDCHNLVTELFECPTHNEIIEKITQWRKNNESKI